MSDLFRIYKADELGPKDYPWDWDRCPDCGATPMMRGICTTCQGAGSIKALVRQQAGHRCIRCGHPYRVGEHGSGEWSPCDEHCAHLGEVRMREIYRGDGSWDEYDLDGIGQPAGESLYDYDAEQRRIQRWECEAHWRILTVHHLDGNKANCRWWNLAALCQRCHLTIQGKVKMNRPWPWPHTDWFKIHAAGFYALKYLAEDIDRAEAEERLDELLALGLEEEAVERLPL